MTRLPKVEFLDEDPSMVNSFEGTIAAVVDEFGQSDDESATDGPLAELIDRFVQSDAFTKLEEGQAARLSCPPGIRAEHLIISKADPSGLPQDLRRAGAAAGKACKTRNLLVLASEMDNPAEYAQGIVLGGYQFNKYKTSADPGKGRETLENIFICMRDADPVELTKEYAVLSCAASGVYETRDLVNEPANVLTTAEFAARLTALKEIGVEVEILEEDILNEFGMNALLAVGQGSSSPSKVGVLRWKGSDDKPVVLIGKGVVFDTGGVSLKPASGMEQMTADMAGAGVVAGVMKALALRQSKANVIGLVGLVENMPSGNAQRPGDIVRSLKGDTIEVVNTDAEGRLVLADLLWYAQTEYKPQAIIDLATLTGAVIVGLGHENAGLFANNRENIVDSFMEAAELEGEGAWRLPMGKAYDKLLKSEFADMKNIGDRTAGAITGAQFLRRFVEDGCPWIHLDIAGVASRSEATAYSTTGATGWGVRTLDRMLKESFESE